MTRRCSVMRMPVAAQRASISPWGVEGTDFRAAIGMPSASAGFRTSRGSGQVTLHDQRAQKLARRLAIILLAAADDLKSGPLVKPDRGEVILLDLEKDRADAVAGKMTEMNLQQLPRQPAAAPGAFDRNGQDLGFVGGEPRNDEADGLVAGTQTVRQRVALGEQLIEFGLAPAAIERSAMQLR